jgi:hypothetical protein
MYITCMFVHKEEIFTLKMETDHLKRFRRPGAGENLVYCFTVNFACFTYFTKLEFELVLLYFLQCLYGDRLCGLVVRVSSYRSRGPGFDSRPYQIF